MDDRYHYNDSYEIRDGKSALFFLLIILFLAVGFFMMAWNVRHEDDLLREKCTVMQPPKECRYIGA